MAINLSTLVENLELEDYYLPPAAPSSVSVLPDEGVDVAPRADDRQQALHTLQPLVPSTEEAQNFPSFTDYEALLEEHLDTDCYYRRPQMNQLQRDNSLYSDQPAPAAGSEEETLPWRLQTNDISSWKLTPIDTPPFFPVRRFDLDLRINPPISPLLSTPSYEPPSDLLQTALTVCDVDYIEWNNISIEEEDIIVEGTTFNINEEIRPCRMDVIQLPNHRLRAVSPPPQDRWWVSSSPPSSPDHPYERSTSPSASQSSTSQPSQQDPPSQSAGDSVNSDNSDKSAKPSDNSDKSNDNRVGPSPKTRDVVPCDYRPSNLDVILTDCQLSNPSRKITPPFKRIQFESLPKVKTDDHVVNSIIENGLKLFLPSITCKDYTPNKHGAHFDNLVQSGVIAELSPQAPKPKMLFRLFPVPKTDPHNPRLIIDFKKLTKHLNPPNFKLPNIIKLMQSHRDSDFMVKLDLMNGFFHIPLHKSAMKEMGIKCGKKYYEFNRLPQGLALAPYFMQRVMHAIIKTFVKDLDIRFLIYLDDFLFLGSKLDLTILIDRLKASDFMFNDAKCILSPTRKLQYLGVNINLDSKSVSLTEDFISNLKKEFNLVKSKILTLRYKQRLAGLINFARHILRLPLSLVSMGFYHPDKLTSLASKFHSNEIKFFSSTSLRKVWCDATPQQIGIYSERFNRVCLFKKDGNILENEYLGILMSHLMFPNDIIINDNRAAVCLFTRGKLPPNLRDNFNLNCVLCHIYKDPIVIWVPSSKNIADKFSRFKLI